MRPEIQDIRDQIREIKAQMVTRGEFQVVQTLVFGLVGLVLCAVGAAVLRLVIQQ